MTIKILIQGNAVRPYIIEALEENNIFRMYCNCPAGGRGWMCKHKESLIKNTFLNSEGNSRDDLNRIQELINKHNILERLANLENLLRYAVTKDDIIDIKQEISYLANPPEIIDITCDINNL